MAIFPRRVVQRLLEENSQYLAPDQVQEHVNRLNGSAVEALATEWEVAVLNVLSKIGKVRHEDSFGTPKKPDVAFYIDGVNAPEFVADVRVVSDAGLHDENPIGLLRSHLYRQLRKKGITTGGFHLSVGTLTPFPRRGEKLQLAIPKRCDLEGFVKKRLSPFFKVIVSNPSDSRAIAFDEPEIRLTIRFDPKARLAFSHHPSYTAVYDRDRNPIFNALTAKAEQLKGISFSGSKGVILCDGACTLLQPGFHSGSSFSLSHVIDRFFKSSRSIGFVLTLAAIEAPRNAPPDVASKIVGNLFTNAHAKAPLSPRAEQILRCIDQSFPKPVHCALTAEGLLRQNQAPGGSSQIRGFSMNGLEIKISSRSLVLLLAGSPLPKLPFTKTPTIGEFHPGVTKYFEQRIKDGRTIQTIRIERNDDSDDDWVVITFGDPDPAISPYVVP